MQPQLQVRHSPGLHAAHSLVVETKIIPSFIPSFIFVFIYALIQTYLLRPNHVFHTDLESGNITGNIVKFVLLRIGCFSQADDKQSMYSWSGGLPVGRTKWGGEIEGAVEGVLFHVYTGGQKDLL